MPDAIRCGGCGAELLDESKRIVDDAIDVWVQKGLLTTTQAALLRAGEAIERRARFTPAVALLAVGGVFVLCAAIMVVAQFWTTMGFAGRLATVLTPTIALYAAAFALGPRGDANRLVTTIVAFFATLLVPIAAWLLVCEVRLPFPCVLHGETGDAEAQRVCLAALISLVIHAATLAKFRHPVLTLPVCGSWLFVLPSAAEWLLPHRHQGTPVSVAILLTGLVMMAAGQVAAGRGKWAFAVVPDIVGSLVALMATTVMGAELGGGWEPLAGAAPLAMIALGCHPKRQRYLIAGMLFLVVNVFRIGLEHFSRTAGLPITLLACGAATMAAGYVVHRLRREYAGSATRG